MVARSVLTAARGVLGSARSVIVSAAPSISPFFRPDLSDFQPLVDVAGADQLAFYDGIINASANPTDLAQVNPWDDQYTGLNLTNGTAAQRPLVNHPRGLFGRRPLLFFDGSNDVLSVPVGTEADFRPLHDGTGVIASGAFFAGNTGLEQQIIATCVGTNGTTQVGISISMLATAALRIRVLRGNAASMLINVDTAPNVIPFNRKIRWLYWLQTGLAPNDEWGFWINEARVAGGTTSVAPSLANPDTRMIVGRQTNSGARFFLGWMAALHLYKNPLTYLDRELNYLAHNFS